MKYTDNNTYWKGCGKTETTIHCCLKCKNVHLPWKIIQQFLRNLDIELPYDPGIRPPGTYPKEQKPHAHDVHSSITYNSQKIEITKMSIN